MAYPKLCEGLSPFTAGSGNGASSADMNALIAQLAAMLGPQIVTCPTAAAWYDVSGAATWQYRAALGYNAWQSAGSGTTALYLPLGTLRAGQVITSVKAVIKGTTTGGSILLQKQLCGAAVAAPTTVATFPSDPFNNASFTLATGTMSAETVVAGWDYYLTFTPPATANYVLGAYYTAQFGN